MHETDTLAEARRLMTICNACRYCEGLCAVFPAMEMRRAFPDGDLDYLANLCHGCGACYIDCQFAPPHEFDVNVPKVFAELRAESYARYVWPSAFGIVFRRNGLVIGLIFAACITAFTAAFYLVAGAQDFFSAHIGDGAFYEIMPHDVMAGLFGGVFVLACAALAIGQRKFSRRAAAPLKASMTTFWQASKNAASLRYLDGGGAGCYHSEAARGDYRRIFHHFTFYGFLLCFASTCVATVYHYAFRWEAPYAWNEAPVILGTLGGFGLIVGPLGLLNEKRFRDPSVSSEESNGMDVAFLMALLLTAATGLALLFLRNTPLMSLLLAIHLGAVLGFFLTLPYGKFVHGLYRFAALMRYAREQSETH
ncbi:MAG: tricarballylate utilization 4Fe-4S protein TcuB [Rhodomicrobium sp.]